MNSAILTLLSPRRWSGFARGMAAYGSAEALNRVVRLGSILVVARQISPTMLGTAALALSLFELVRVLTNVGIGQRIVVAKDAELEAICRTAHRSFYLVCYLVAAIQLVVAFIVWHVFGLDEAAAMLAALSLVYPFMPAGLVQIFLAMRAQRLGATARVSAIQNMADSALTAVLLTAPIWLVLARRTFEWTPNSAVRPAPIAAFHGFGPAILGSEVLTALRLHADKLLIGALLGTEALGLYFFAFNAGLGITQALVAACNLVLLPHLAKAEGLQLEEEFARAFRLGMTVAIPLVAAQALLAPIYVPLVFGKTWVDTVPFVSVLACAAIPLFAGALLGARARALGKPFAETKLMAIATISAFAGLTLGAQISLLAACVGFGVGLSAILLPAATLQLRTSHRPEILYPKGDA